MRRLAHSLVLVLALGTGTVSAQSVVDARLAASHLDPKTHAAVVAIIDSARMANLPTEPLIVKALEGAAKRAAGPQIVSAVRTYAGQLVEARRALGAASTPPEIVGGAQAIRAGMSVQQLEKLRRVRPSLQIATALTVASDLVAREVPIDTAVAVVSGLMSASATDDQLLAVRGDIETDILNGKPPAVAASTRGQALTQTLAAQTPPNGAGTPGTLPSASGTSRGADGLNGLKPPGQAVGARAPADAPTKPPASQRKRP
jgi:hypothetical protein